MIYTQSLFTLIILIYFVTSLLLGLLGLPLLPSFFLFFHHLSHMLQDDKSVHLIALDFSKAFDTVRYSTLAANISSFPISDNVYNWIVNFLSDRQHQTRANDSRSDFKSINASIIQGSGLGPVASGLHSQYASDLCSAHQSNLIFKYADDTYLIIHDIHLHTIPLELQHISDWADRHNLQ